ncbi:MAG: HD domain-containing protein [Treponemataceae bacterium]|nr:HD domain-containing protein [Treponemataceae bacterium]
MLTKQLALKLFEAFSIERWNDLIRPFEIVEMDKAAEKMVLAYIIGKYEEQDGKELDWDWMIHASLFDLLKKIALCDIKSPVQRMIRSEYPDEYARLNNWVLGQYYDLLQDEDLYAQFCDYIHGTDSAQLEGEAAERRQLSSRVLRAAHKYSAMREFEMLSVVNEPYRTRNIEKQLNEDIAEFLDLKGLQLLITRQRPYEFLMVIEQLRFQTRWNQTPRVPRTSVLGHSFYVAILTMLLGRQPGLTMCENRRYNNFFSALFHDLPEAVTRDIISPVKQATDELPSIVKRIEDEIVQKELIPLMEPFYADELLYFTSDEFENRIVIPTPNGSKSTSKYAYTLEQVTFEDLNAKFNNAQYCPVDGKLVRCADHISAFIEADRSIKYGISSNHLQEGRANIMKSYISKTNINGFNPKEFYSQFES